MSKAAQLKKKASEFEYRKQYDRALEAYVQAIEAAAGLPDEIDISLYNRVGDLHLRLGALDRALVYYETAIDLYAEGGFFNNAIALCNKVLRHAPSRSSVYYKLGKISAKKGFNSDAKQNFLEYADRMQKGGDTDEAFRALKEFADLCPGQDDVRLMLADQLGRAGRTEEALEQLQLAYDVMVAEDRLTEASATLERMRLLDPAAELKPSQGSRQAKYDRLVFIDVDDEAHTGGAPGREDAGDGGDPQPLSEAAAEPVIQGHPLSAEEFGSVDLPPPADLGGGEASHESPIDGIVPLDEPPGALGALTLDGPQRETVQTFDVMAVEIPSIVDDPTSLVTTRGDAAHDLQERSTGAPVEGFEPTNEDVTADLVRTSRPPSLEDVAEGDVAAPGRQPTPWEFGPASEAATDHDFVDLQEWLREAEPPKNPRMVAEGEAPPPGAVQTDFTGMLDAFKRGIAQNLDEGDVESHYDLGVAYMEMGLCDEAIAQFQTVIRGNVTPERRVRAYEALGRCFIEQGQYDIAVTSLGGVVQEPGRSEEKLVGVLYLLGYASEALNRWGDAVAYYQRVFAVDIHFRDVGDRLLLAKEAAAKAVAS